MIKDILFNTLCYIGVVALFIFLLGYILDKTICKTEYIVKIAKIIKNNRKYEWLTEHRSDYLVIRISDHEVMSDDSMPCSVDRDIAILEETLKLRKFLKAAED